MAEFDTGAPQAAPETGKTLGFLVNWAGALTSLALLGGIAVWGYDILSRDVSGVPVVRAVEGPMRVQPEDPGGREAAHQGLAVNEVAAEGSAAAPADRLVLAPRPVDLAPEDDPPAQIAPATLQPLPEELTPATLSTTEDVAVEDDGASAIPAAIQALADQIAAGAKPLSNSGPADTPPVKTEVAAASPAIEEQTQEAPTTEVAAEAATVDPALVNAPGVRVSLRPQVRPNGPQVASLDTSSAVNAAVAEANTAEISPETIPAGTRLVQLGAFDSPEVARSEWDRLSQRFAGYLDDKQRVVQRAKSGGRTFYRLRAMGFADLSDARRFCSTLVAGNADCIPVVTR